MPNKNVLVHRGALGHTRKYNNVIYGGDLSHMDLLELRKGWKGSSAMGVVHRGHRGWASFHSWQCFAHAVTHQHQESNTAHHATEEDNRSGLSWVLPHAPLRLADYNRYPSAVMSCNVTTSMTAFNASCKSFW